MKLPRTLLFSFLIWLTPVVVFTTGVSAYPSGSTGSRRSMTLLVAFDPTGVSNALLRWRVRNYRDKLIRTFREAFQTDYELIIRQDADQHDLWTALHAPENDGVFWISHGGIQEFSLPGIRDRDAIVDTRGFDATPLFRYVNPNLKFLAVIGCHSKGVIEKMAVRPAGSSQLLIKAFEPRVDALRGLRVSVQMALERLRKTTADAQSGASWKQGIAIQVTRTLPSTSDALMPPVRIELAGQVLGVFPAGHAGEIQEMTVWAPTALAVRGFRLVANAGDDLTSLNRDVQIGTFAFNHSCEGAKWLVFQSRKGEVLGVTKHVYELKTDPILILQSSAPYASP